MGLLDDLGNPPKKQASFAAWMIQQTPEVRAALEAAAGDDRWTNNALINVLRKYSAPCSRETVVAWRKKHGHVA